MEEYCIIDISDVEQIDFEQMGTKSKFWFKDANDDLFLFKATLSTDNQGNDIQRDGEDWAEKIACEVAKLLNIPCANYELAVYNGQRGVITKNFVSSDENMQYGNTMLMDLYTILDMPPLEPNHSHQIPAIGTCLDVDVKNKPVGWRSLPDIKTATDVFIGYLMLDVLISNQDRHNENWGMVVSNNQHPYLAPTFDHAASLGRNENDEKRSQRLNSIDKGQSIGTYVARAKSQILDRNCKRLKTIDAFQVFSLVAGPKAALSWLRKLHSINIDEMLEIINRVPSHIMSEISKEFAFAILNENYKRLISLLPYFESKLKEASNNE